MLLRTLLVLVIAIVALALWFYFRPFGMAREATRAKLWLQGVRGHETKINGYRIHYLELKPKAESGNRPLVLIHGLGGSAQDWAPLMAPLAKEGFHIYAIDLLGFGDSQAPDVAYSVPLEAKIAEQWIAQLGLQKFALAGWSAGGWVAQMVALDMQDSVDHLVLYNSAGIRFDLSWATKAYGAKTIEEARAFGTKVSPNSRPLPGFIARDFLRILQQTRWVNLRMLDSMLAGPDMLDYRLPSLQVPTALIWGAADTMTPISAAEHMHELIPNSTLVRIEGGGHLAPAENTAAVLDATLKFLKDLSPHRSTSLSHSQSAQVPSPLKRG